MSIFEVYALGDNNYSNWWLEYEGDLTFLGTKDRDHKELVSHTQAVEKARYFLQNGELPLERCQTCGHHTFRPKENYANRIQASEQRRRLKDASKVE